MEGAGCWLGRLADFVAAAGTAQIGDIHALDERVLVGVQELHRSRAARDKVLVQNLDQVGERGKGNGTCHEKPPEGVHWLVKLDPKCKLLS